MDEFDKWAAFLLVGAALLAVIYGFPAHAGPLEATVTVTVPGSVVPITGAGVVVHKGMVITAAHVVRGTRMVMLGRGDSMVRAIVAQVDDGLDLAILSGDIECPCVPLAELDPPRLTHVETHGYPMGMLITTEGRVQVYDNKGFLVVTAPVSPGNSGGGVFNDKGELVGIVSHVAGYGESLVTHITFMVPVEVVTKFIGSR